MQKQLPKLFEEEIYNYWQKKGFFASKPNSQKKPYTVLMPPPNVTGILHMGHVLNNTIQDILVRKARLEGKEACWVPGIDHASIATEAKVVQMLKRQGIEKDSLSREKFLDYAWKWKEEHGNIIINQLKYLGISCDWSRLKFTLDQDMYDSVLEIFIKLYDEGYIYRAARMINWDPEGKTALSDDEVIYKEVEGTLSYIKYKLVGKEDYVVIATSRPETIMGDTAVCVNPKDKRYKHLIGEQVVVPMINRLIPIIGDEYVSMDFGTGCLKVTPAHDMNDAELGQKHNLESIDIFNDDGTLNENAQIFIGLDRFEARQRVIERLKQDGFLSEEKVYIHNVGFSERTDAIIEPKVSIQWFVRMKELAKPALQNVLNDNIKFYPSKFKNMYKTWMENVKDWCISRQLWWGHRIPAYYLNDGTFIIAKNLQEALVKAKQETGNNNLKEIDLRQDEDVLDTWFSSALWPISVFGGIIDPENPEINYYYPTNDLVTAPEIIFFWVARMIIFGYKIKNELPFKNVYFTGIVRDEKKRKMSKSLGNSPDPIQLMQKYGVDGVRAGIILSAPAGNDLLFNEKLCEQGRNFTNKLWNVLKLIKKWEEETCTSSLSDQENIGIKWFEHKLNYTLDHIEKTFKLYKLSECFMIVYKLLWDDFCSLYIEMIKPSKNNNISLIAHKKTVEFFENILKILHPFMPFITEKAWQIIGGKYHKEESICISSWPTNKAYDFGYLEKVDLSFELISKVRRLRKEHNLSSKVLLKIYVEKDDSLWVKDTHSIISKLCNVEIEKSLKKEIFSESNVAELIVGNTNFIVPISKSIDKEKETLALQKELKYYQDFVFKIEKKLSNESFIANAPKEIINKEKQKLKDLKGKIILLQKNE